MHACTLGVGCSLSADPQQQLHFTKVRQQLLTYCVAALQAYHSLVEWASQEPPAQQAGATPADVGEDEAMATDSGADQAAAALASKQLRLAELRAYARTYAADTAPLLERLLAEVLPEGGAVPEDVRHTLLGALRLPLDSMTD